MSFWKEILTGGYHGDKDIIIGCKKGSLVWWHERGHQLLAKDKFYKTANNSIQTWLGVMLVFLFASQENLFLSGFGFLWGSILFGQEFGAWLIAFKNYKGGLK